MNFVVYKWSCKDISITDFYIGYSKNFNERVKQHKTSLKCSCFYGKGIKKYEFINAHGGFDNWEFKIIAKFSSEKDARDYEGRLIWKLKPSLNLNGLIGNTPIIITLNS